MNKTPNSNRIHISFFGNRNAGKSSLLNALTNQDISVVSDVAGTTTDPVKKAMELLPIGPVLFIDTAGLDDIGELGQKRIQKTLQILGQTNYALHIIRADEIDETAYNTMKEEYIKYNIPHLLVISQTDRIDKERLFTLKSKYKNAFFLNINDNTQINLLKDKLIKELAILELKEPTMIGDIVPYNGKVVMVVPVDSEAPKGRIILPQVQLIRDCLDHGIKSYVTRDLELESALNDLLDIDLVVTDSQAFKEVDKIVPKNIELTSFSIILSRIKGDLNRFINDVYTIDKLKEGACILIAESCSHNSTCDDIGRVKIPRLLQNYTNKTFKFDVVAGKNFPSEIDKYDLVIHCAGCMLNKKAMQTIISKCVSKNIPITNYGVILSYLNGILDRATNCFKKFKGDIL